MSIIEKLGQAIDQKNESAMNELLHDDYKFTMHSNGAVLTKQDVIGWAMAWPNFSIIDIMFPFYFVYL